MSHHAAYRVPLTKLRVAIVDDIAQMTDLLRLMLRTAGVEQIRSFTSPRQFVRSCHEDLPHVVITDIHMGPKSGFDLIDMMRQRKVNPLCYLAIVVMSTDATKNNILQALAKGANDFLVKPLSANTVRKCMERVTNDPRYFVVDGERVVLKSPSRAAAGERGPDRKGEDVVLV